MTLGFGQIIIAIIRTIEEVGGASWHSPTTVPTIDQLSPGSFAHWSRCAFCRCAIWPIPILGRSMRAVREDEIAAEAAGIDTTRVKVLAFVISALWAGVAGGLYAHYPPRWRIPNDFDFVRSVEVVVMVVLGGLGSITGATMTAVVLQVTGRITAQYRRRFLGRPDLDGLAAALAFPRHRLAMLRNNRAELVALAASGRCFPLLLRFSVRSFLDRKP